MNTLFSSIGLLFLLLLPSFAAAKENVSLSVAGRSPTSQALTRPSRRQIRSQILELNPRNTSQRSTISEVTLDSTFANADFGIKIQYPSLWQRLDLMEYTPPLTLVSMFLADTKSIADIRQNINLVVEDLPEGTLSLAEYSELGVAMTRKYLDRFVLVSRNDIIVAGAYRAHRVIFTASASGDMMFEQIWMLRGRTAHVWTFADSATTFEKNVKTFERMMDTITVQ